MMPGGSAAMTIEHLARRIERVDSTLRKKADKADVKQLERKFDTRFSRVEKRADRLEARLNIMNDSMNGRFDRLERLLRVDSAEQRRILDEHEDRIRDLAHPR